MKLFTPEELSLLSPREAELYQHQLEYEIAKQSPLDLACWISPETQRTPHLEYINERIVALVEHRLYKSGPGPDAHWFYRKIEDGPALPALGPAHIPESAVDFWGEHPETGERVVYKLGIAVPPRHGKSWIVTEHLPLWFWMRHPDADIAFATYSDTFAVSWGRKMRARLLEKAGKLGLNLVNGHRHASDHLYFDETNGNMFLVGTGGSLTGKGWQLGIIDDPFKDASEALSEAQRQNKAEWYESVFDTRATRLGHPGLPVQIMMFTRWHEDDLAGRYIYDEKRQVRDDWHMIRLPALAVEGDPLGRAPGEALWPAVLTAQELRKRQERDPLWFAAMFQGNPTMGDQGLFPKWHTYTKDNGVYTWEDHDGLHKIQSADCTRYATVDTAYTTNTWSDYSVYAVWDWHRPSQRLFLVDVDRVRVNSPDLSEWVQTCTKRWNPVYVGVEDVTSGKALLQEMQRTTKIPFRFLKPDRDKVSRALAYGQAASNGLILIPNQGGWVSQWMEEHSSFPNGTHDDMVDAGAYGWNIAKDMPSIERQSRYAQYDGSMEGRRKRLEEKMDREAVRKNKGRRRGWQGRLGR